MEVSKVQSEIQQQKFMPIQKSESQVEEKIEEKIEDRSPAAEILITNTDKVDQEIERLKSRESKLLEEIRSKIEPDSDIEEELSNIKDELRLKDNDTYRRAHAEYFSE